MSCLKAVVFQLLAKQDSASVSFSCCLTDCCIFLTGHAIYSIETVKDKVSNSTRTLLEEPRAELTASHTLRLLAQQGYISHVKPQFLTSSCTALSPYTLIMFAKVL